MLADNFEALITFDKNLAHQQNFKKCPIPVIVLNAPNNTYAILHSLIPAIKGLLANDIQPGVVELNHQCLE